MSRTQKLKFINLLYLRKFLTTVYKIQQVFFFVFPATLALYVSVHVFLFVKFSSKESLIDLRNRTIFDFIFFRFPPPTCCIQRLYLMVLTSISLANFPSDQKMLLHRISLNLLKVRYWFPVLNVDESQSYFPGTESPVTM